MKKVSILIVSILVLGLVITSLLSGCSPGDTSKLKVVTSTALLAQIVERVGGEKVDVVNIIPPAQCPGHFDVKPGDILKLADADLFLLHGWQGEKFTDDLIASADNSDLSVFKVDVLGNWMTPPVQSQAIDIIAGIINQADADNSAGFVKWAGFNIIATYGRPDSLTPQVVKELVDKGREGKVTLIIDNMQSGQDAGAGIAEELGSARVILSNFPGCYENTETWEKTIDYNVALLLAAIGR